MNPITPLDVLAFEVQAITDPQRRQEIEQARESDPLVQYCFDLLDPNYEDEEVPEIFLRQAETVLRTILPEPEPQPKPTIESGKVAIQGNAYVSEHEVTWQLAADAGSPALPSLPLETGEAHRYDPDTCTWTVEHPVAALPFGVARLQLRSRNTGEILGTTLAVFRTQKRGEQEMLEAKVHLDDFGIPKEQYPAIFSQTVQLYVVKVTETNRDQFPMEQVLALRDACDGNLRLRAKVNELLKWLETKESGG